MIFADTNVGKSIKAVQIGVHVAENGLIVLYIDFELSDKQFENRYANNYANHYRFPENFYRAEINPEQADFQARGFRTIEDYLTASIRNAIVQTGATVVIIDNLTYLRTETEKAKDALPLMKNLKILQRELGLSILCLAHTPKRNQANPITVNDMAGSKMLMNFCDSAFAIGQSAQDKSLRYIKQVKCRAGEIRYDAENVALYNIVKPDNYLHFEFFGYSTERQHLKQLTEKDKQEINENVLEMHSAGRSLRKIGESLNISHTTACRIIKKRNHL